jgi:HlyD family secretion protein
MQEYVDEQAKTRLPRTYVVTMPFAGRIEQIPWSEGDRVDPAESLPLAQIVPEDLADDVAESQAAVERLEAAIEEKSDTSVEQTTRQQAEHFVKSMADTVEAAGARVGASESRVDFASRALERSRSLPQGTGFTRVAGAIGTAVDRGADRLSPGCVVSQSLRSIKAATDLLPRIVDEYIGRKKLQTSVLEKEKAEALVRKRQALKRQVRGVIKPPFAGVVLERHVDNEQFLPAGAELVTLGRLEELQIEADILSRDVVRIRPGQAVEIYDYAAGGDAEPRFEGRVASIFPAGFTKISSLGVEQQRVKVVIEPTEASRIKMLERQIGVEYRVRVRIFTETAPDATTVPRSALFRGPDGGWEVYALRAGRLALVPVEVGLLNDEESQITKGLGRDDLVALAPESSFSPGMRAEPIMRGSK